MGVWNEKLKNFRDFMSNTHPQIEGGPVGDGGQVVHVYIRSHSLVYTSKPETMDMHTSVHKGTST